jgi:hypothetical protein
MLSKLLIAWGLMASCVMIHAVGVAWVATRSVPGRVPPSQELGAWVWIFVRIAGWLVLLHLIEITLWALFYAWSQALPGMHAALYFSAVTYTTTGYGDLLLPQKWQLVGAVEALTGILMCGWSTGFIFAVVSRMLKTNITPRDSTL